MSTMILLGFLSMNIIWTSIDCADQNKDTLLDIMSGFRNYYRIIRTLGGFGIGRSARRLGGLCGGGGINSDGPEIFPLDKSSEGVPNILQMPARIEYNLPE